MHQKGGSPIWQHSVMEISCRERTWRAVSQSSKVLVANSSLQFWSDDPVGRISRSCQMGRRRAAWHANLTFDFTTSPSQLVHD
jgi:hypothetical protein